MFAVNASPNEPDTSFPIPRPSAINPHTMMGPTALLPPLLVLLSSPRPGGALVIGRGQPLHDRALDCVPYDGKHHGTILGDCPSFQSQLATHTPGRIRLPIKTLITPYICDDLNMLDGAPRARKKETYNAAKETNTASSSMRVPWSCDQSS